MVSPKDRYASLFTLCQNKNWRYTLLTNQRLNGTIGHRQGSVEMILSDGMTLQYLDWVAMTCADWKTAVAASVYSCSSYSSGSRTFRRLKPPLNRARLRLKAVVPSKVYLPATNKGRFSQSHLQPWPGHEPVKWHNMTCVSLRTAWAKHGPGCGTKKQPDSTSMSTRQRLWRKTQCKADE